MRTLLRFVLIASITLLTLLACNSPYLKTTLENPKFPPLPIVNLKDIEPERTPDAPYLPTPQAVVLKMLEIAKVTESDTVYDLGSGDGRIAIAAAQKFGAKAIGIEIDPELIRESTRESKPAIAQTPEIRDRLKFIRQDLFKTDLDKATVITLYLLPEANLRFRTEILPKLTAGTRIVSHEYDLGDLAPNQTETIKVGDREHIIHLWVL